MTGQRSSTRVFYSPLRYHYTAARTCRGVLACRDEAGGGGARHQQYAARRRQVADQVGAGVTHTAGAVGGAAAGRAAVTVWRCGAVRGRRHAGSQLLTGEDST